MPIFIHNFIVSPFFFLSPTISFHFPLFHLPLLVGHDYPHEEGTRHIKHVYKAQGTRYKAKEQLEVGRYSVNGTVYVDMRGR